MNAYCHGQWVTLAERDGRYWCPSCGKRLWETNATFSLTDERIGSEHGDNQETGGDEEASGEVEA